MSKNTHEGNTGCLDDDFRITLRRDGMTVESENDVCHACALTVTLAAVSQFIAEMKKIGEESSAVQILATYLRIISEEILPESIKHVDYDTASPTTDKIGQA